MKRDAILNEIKTYMSQINLQHGTTTDRGEKEEWKTKEEQEAQLSPNDRAMRRVN